MPKLNRPIPLVLSGGTVMAPGFCDRFEKTLRIRNACGDLGNRLDRVRSNSTAEARWFGLSEL